MKLYASFVGIDTYSDLAIRPLRFAKRDAESFYELLQSSLDADDCQLECLLDGDATKTGILKAIGENTSRLATEIHFLSWLFP